MKPGINPFDLSVGHPALEEIRALADFVRKQ